MSTDFSLCMIVRRRGGAAARVPARRRVVLGNQLVAVDTGSADAMPDLRAAAGAEGFTARFLPRPQQKPAPRARPRWVLVLDADEFPGRPGPASPWNCAPVVDPAVAAVTI